MQRQVSRGSEGSFRALGALLLTLSVLACRSTPPLRFAPEVQNTELRGEAGDVQARVVVAWREAAEQDGSTDFRFRIRIENPGPTSFVLVPAEFELLDGELNAIGLALTDAMPVLVEAEQFATFDLSIPVLADPALEAFNLDALTLRCRLQGARWNWTTTFLRDKRPAYY